MARLIDTSVIVELERAGRLYEADENGASERSAISSITAAELLLGVERADSPVRRARRANFVEAVLTELLVVPFDLPAARTHARLLAQLLAIGQMIGRNDLMIAATALAHGFDVVTHNRHDFERVPGLRVWMAP